MTANGHDASPGRETRLLVLVVVVALAALLVLARVRFPAAEPAAVAPAAGPLDRLAARSPVEDLEAALTTVLDRVSPSIVIVQLESVPPPEPTRRKTPQTAAPPVTRRLVPALRVRDDLALVAVSADERIDTSAGAPTLVAAVSTDAARGIALVRVPSADAAVPLPARAALFGGFEFVAVVEAAAGGPSVRPVYLGRVDPLTDPAWGSIPLALVGGEPQVSDGALVFALDGRLIGLAMRRPGGLTIAPVTALGAVVDQLLAGAGGPS